MNDRPRFALRFISGKYQGGEFPLRMNREIIIGRSSDLDMVLVEDMVSRKHAGIHVQADQVWIEDLGSTNGTFVNRSRVTAAVPVQRGDQVQIGNTVLELG
jgi:pSer/pThr/pTyr-binding forkhead associated (FHA) protein